MDRDLAKRDVREYADPGQTNVPNRSFERHLRDLGFGTEEEEVSTPFIVSAGIWFSVHCENLMVGAVENRRGIYCLETHVIESMTTRRNVIGIVCDELYTSAAFLRQGHVQLLHWARLSVPHSVVVVTFGTHV